MMAKILKEYPKTKSFFNKFNNSDIEENSEFLNDLFITKKIPALTSDDYETNDKCVFYALAAFCKGDYLKSCEILKEIIKYKTKYIYQSYYILVKISYDYKMDYESLIDDFITNNEGNIDTLIDMKKTTELSSELEKIYTCYSYILNLCGCYYMMKINYEKAKIYFRMAIKFNLSKAFFNMAQISIAEKNHFDTIGYYLLAIKSDENNSDYIYQLAKYLEPEYNIMAIKYYTQAAEKGCDKSMKKLGDHYYMRDNSKSIYYYTQAAEKGNINSMEKLGNYYLSYSPNLISYEKYMLMAIKAKNDLV